MMTTEELKEAAKKLYAELGGLGSRKARIVGALFKTIDRLEMEDQAFKERLRSELRQLLESLGNEE